MKNDRALDRWVNLKSSAQETKKRLKMLHLSFASFAVRAAAPLLLESLSSSCFRFFQVPRESPFVSRSCSLKYLCFSFLSFKVTTLRKSDPTRPETQITYPRDGRQSLAPVDINTRERKERGRETVSHPECE